MDASRRRFLAAAGAGIASLAGCTAPDSDPSVGGLVESDEQPFADLYEAVAPSVVRVQVYDSSGVRGSGSGWLYDDGVVVTNDHVITGATTVRIQFADGDWATAEVLGSDPYSDLAALSVEYDGDPSPLPLVEEQQPIGTPVAALGSPLGLGGTLTSGVISGQDRSITSIRNFTIPDAVQTDAALNPGNSGGPLLTTGGEVVGVNTQGGGENIGFAVSAALARRVIPALIETGNYEHSYLGIRLLPVTPLLAEANGLDEVRGVYVAAVPEDGPAGGVLRGGSDLVSVGGSPQPAGGDVIVALDDTPVPTAEALGSFLALETSPGDTIDVTLIRDEAERTVEVTLGTRPEP